MKIIYHFRLLHKVNLYSDVFDHGYGFKTSILKSNQVKRTSQDYINEFIIWTFNPLVVSRMQ